MEMKVVCVLILGTLVLADNSTEVNNTENIEISPAENSTEVNTTTQKAETSTESPCDQSLYSKTDLKLIIDFVANSLSIDKNINDTIQTKAVPVLKKHVQWIMSTMNWFSNRPEHLKHILEDVSVTRHHLERTVGEIRKSFEKYPEFVSLYQEKVENMNAILKKIMHYKQLCEVNCGATEVEFRSAITGSRSDRYCGTIAEIHKTTQERLVNFADEHTKRIHQKVIEADEKYNEIVQTRINELKNVALKEFGHTMYDILNLQDLYHHIKKDLKEFNNDYWLMALKTLNIQIDAIILKLDNVVEYFGTYCKNCNRNHRYREAVVYRQRVDAVEKANLLDSVINNRIVEISNNTDAELLTIFKELDESLNKTIMDDVFIEHLEPIHREVTELTKNEIEAFNELQISKLSIDMDLVKKLIANTKDLLNAMAREYKAIVAIVRDLVPV